MKKLFQIGEFGLIELFRKKSKFKIQQLRLGIGDDCCVVQLSGKKLLLLTTDALLEKVHFDLKYCSFYDLGFKAMAANLSDIASMGGLPKLALVCLGLPPNLEVKNALKLYAGIYELAKRFHTSIAGGDIISSPDRVFINLSILGEVEKEFLKTRSAAKKDDLICVTGNLGEAELGLQLLQKFKKSNQTFPPASLIKKHLRPVPKVKEARFLVENYRINAMIDISDGLLSDLKHICEESRLGAKIDGEKIPVSPRVKKFARALKRDPLQLALSSGEEYELLFTIPKNQKEKILQNKKLKISVIGEMNSLKNKIAVVRNNQEVKISKLGYTHF